MSLNPLRYDYNEKDWKKYTTKEERDAISKAERALVPYVGMRVFEGAMMPAIPTGAMLLAAATPRWTLDEMNRKVDTYGKFPYVFIPGYDSYKSLKVLGLQRSIQKRVENSAREAKASKPDT